MKRLPLTLRQATSNERDVILDLLSDSIQWLHGMGIDQWARPWPDEERRNQRIAQDLAEGKTWLALDDTAVAGTITIDPADNGVWPADRCREKAIYIRKVIVRRHYAGLGLGARLFDWAADVAARVHEARWIRIDVWTTNRRLHAYYTTLASGSAISPRIRTTHPVPSSSGVRTGGGRTTAPCSDRRLRLHSGVTTDRRTGAD